MSVLETKVTVLEEEMKRIAVLLNAKQEPSQTTAVSALESKVLTLETNLQLMATLFQQNQQEIKQVIAKLEQCCAEPKPVPPAPIDPNQDVIVLSGVNFDTGTSNLTDGDKKKLTDVAATLKRALPNQRFEVARPG
jgi:outer membrane protein OmpA-like peptidoglycan-associated protein